MALSKSQQNAKDKQIAIVQAAQNLFLESGYAVTRMDEVAKLSGVTKQTVYRYYPSKAELFFAVMEKIRAAEPAPYAFGDEDLHTELNNFGRDLLAFHLTPAALGVYKLIISEGGHAGLSEPFMKAGPNRVMKPLVGFLQARHPELEDAAFHAQMFASMVLVPRNQLIMGSKKHVSEAEQATHVHKVVGLFLQGMTRY